MPRVLVLRNLGSWRKIFGGRLIDPRPAVVDSLQGGRTFFSNDFSVFPVERVAFCFPIFCLQLTDFGDRHVNCHAIVP